MKTRVSVLALGLAVLSAGGEKRIVGAGDGENQDLRLHGKLFLDPASIKALVGSDLSGNFIVVEVKIEPKYGKEITIDRDDFVLRTDKDGDKSTPFAPSQIAGRAELVVPHHKASGGEGSPLYGGPAPNVNGNVVAKDNAGASDAALEKALNDKVLPEGKTDQPVSGLLYFSLDKQKLKDLELDYGGRGENRIALRFKQQQENSR
jgi:hypothetical protein